MSLLRFTPALLAATVALAGAGPLWAQDGAPAPPPAQALTLGRVLAAALRQNPDLARASVDVARADAAAYAAAGVDDWLLTASLGAFIQRNKAVAGTVTGTDAVDIYSVDAEISRLLSTGGSVAVAFSGARRKTLFTATGGETHSYSGEVLVTATQPLLRGRGEAVARAEQHRASIEADAERLTREAQVRDVVRQIVNAYWDVALAWQDLTIRKDSLALATERRRITAAAIEAGTVAPTEALPVEQSIASREEEVIAAQLAITDRSLDLRNLALLELDPGNLDIKPLTPVQAPERTFDEAKLVETAKNQSPELAALRRRGEGATIQVEVTKNGLLPRLDLSVSVGPQGTDQSFGGAAKRLATFKGYSVTGNLTYQQTLSNRAARGAELQAHEELRRITIDQRAMEQQIEVAVIRAVRQARVARKRIELDQRTVALAQRNIEAEQARFELGRSTNFDVLLRQDELKQAQLKLAHATVDLLKAQATIDSLTGAILDRYGISVSTNPRR